MTRKDFCLKCNYSRLYFLKSEDFIKKTDGIAVFRFVSTKEEDKVNFLHKERDLERRKIIAKDKNLGSKKMSQAKKNKLQSKRNSEKDIEKTRKTRLGHPEKREKMEAKAGKKQSKFSAKQKFILLVSGAFIGLLNGFFGGGGGMVCVPILEKVLSLDSKHSHATAIAVIFPLSLVSAIIYVVNGYIKTLSLVTVGIGVVAGGILGAFSLKFLPPKVVQILFAIIMFAGGIKLIL